MWQRRQSWRRADNGVMAAAAAYRGIGGGVSARRNVGGGNHVAGNQAAASASAYRNGRMTEMAAISEMKAKSSWRRRSVYDDALMYQQRNISAYVSASGKKKSGQRALMTPWQRSWRRVWRGASLRCARVKKHRGIKSQRVSAAAAAQRNSVINMA